MSQTSQSHQPQAIDQGAYWNEHGGEKWVANIDHINRMIRVFNGYLFDAAGAQTGEHVLDVGCGGGTTSARFAEQVDPGGTVLGVDVSQVILDTARERYANIGNLHLELGDAASFAFVKNHFDLMVSRFGVMFFEQPVAAFKNLHAALKPGGRTAFICWRALELNPWMAAPAAAAFEFLPRPQPPDPHAPGPFAFADSQRLHTLLTDAGFHPTQIEPVDEQLALGSMEQATDFLTNMGPAAAALQEADTAQRELAIRAISNTVEDYRTGDSVSMPGAVWVVTATAAA